MEIKTTLLGLAALIAHAGLLALGVTGIAQEFEHPTDMPFGTVLGYMFISNVIVSTVAAVVLFRSIRDFHTVFRNSNRNRHGQTPTAFAYKKTFIAMICAMPFGVMSDVMSLAVGLLGFLVGPLSVILPYIVINSQAQRPE